MNRFVDAVDEFMAGSSQASMKAIIELAIERRLTNHEIGHLAQRLANSGERSTIPGSSPLVDIASTGGPSSLSTLLCPLFLMCLDARVAKLAVPGRPAGGVDAMAQIPGYRVDLTLREVSQVLDSCGYAHFLASGVHAPKDGELYAYRKRNGAVNIPELAIASLLSKKLAVGISLMGLDIRVAPHGNFGASWNEARANAQRFKEVATDIGIAATCFLTDGRVPYQPYIGRGEALTALWLILEGKQDPWLDQHLRTCFAMVKLAIGRRAACLPDRQDLRQCLSRHLAAQGSDIRCFDDRVAELRDCQRSTLIAEEEGFLVVNLETLRDALVGTQDKWKKPDNRFPDPTGLVLQRKTGDYVLKGEALATVRCHPSVDEGFLQQIKRAFPVVSSPGEMGRFEEYPHA